MEMKTGDFDAVQTGVYKDNHQIKAGRLKDGNFKVKSMKIVKENGVEAFPPVSVSLGNTSNAIEFLLAYLKELTGDDYVVAGKQVNEQTETPY